MEITILNQEEKPLLHRSEIKAKAFFKQGVPSRQEIAEAIVKKTGGKRELLIISSIHPAYGETSATITARQYSDKSAMEKLERENLVAKNKKVEPEPEKVEEATEEKSSSEDETISQDLETQE